MQYKVRGLMGTSINNGSLRFRFNPWAMESHAYSDAHCHLQESCKKEWEA
jgi:hypothetical protein